LTCLSFAPIVFIGEIIVSIRFEDELILFQNIDPVGKKRILKVGDIS
jgi:hypothetical protein